MNCNIKNDFIMCTDMFEAIEVVLLRYEVPRNDEAAKD